MIVFSERKLAQCLHDDAVTEKQQLYYCAILLGVVASNDAVGFAINDVLHAKDFAIDALHVIANGAMLFYAFLVNSKGDGRNVVARFICLYVPIGFKLFVLTCTLMALFFCLRFYILDPNHPGWLLSELFKSGVTDKERLEKLWDYSLHPIVGMCAVILILFWARRIKIAFKIASGQS